MSSSRIAARRARAVESLRTAAEAIGPVEAGLSVFAVTRGQWSMIDAIRYLAAQVAPADVSVWTWCIADYEAECFEGLMADGAIGSALLVIDQSGARRTPELVGRWQARFGAESVRICLNHAKLSRIAGRGLRMLARGSMNLNANPRFEQFDLTEGGPEYGLVAELEASLPVLGPVWSHREAVEASGVAEAWPSGELRRFEAGKVWAK